MAAHLIAVRGDGERAAQPKRGVRVGDAAVRGRLYFGADDDACAVTLWREIHICERESAVLCGVVRIAGIDG